MSKLDSFNLIRWHSNGYWKTPLACSAFLNFWDVRMEVLALKGLSNIQEFYMLRLVRRCIIPCCVRASCLKLALQSSVSRLKVVDWKVLSNIQEFIINMIPTHPHALHVAGALSCLQFVLTMTNLLQFPPQVETQPSLECSANIILCVT